jgi:pimeloyl-ACP methyl ester carboxylesterase
MVEWQKRVIPAIAATSLLLGAGTVTSAVSEAEEAVLIPGATVFKRINPLYPILANTFYPVIGINFHDDQNPRVIDYSQNALAADRAILDGVEQTIAAEEIDGQVVVIGESMGSMVASRVAVELANSGPDAPSTDDIRFVLIAPPEAGIAEYFKEGTFIPLLNYRISRVPESKYHTTIVIGEYDGWADPPDRPWNVVSLANAVMGMAFVHGPPISAADPASVPKANTTVRTNSLGGTVVTHLVPTENLPLTQPLRLIGIPDKVVDRADRVLRPIVDAGYRRHDAPGDSRPYLADGGIHRNVQSQQLEREQSREVVEKKPDDRQQRRNDLHDRVERRSQQLTTKIAERRADRRAERASGESDSGQSERPPTTLHSPWSSAKNAVGTRDR